MTAIMLGLTLSLLVGTLWATGRCSGSRVLGIGWRTFKGPPIIKLSGRNESGDGEYGDPSRQIFFAPAAARVTAIFQKSVQHQLSSPSEQLLMFLSRERQLGVKYLGRILWKRNNCNLSRLTVIGDFGDWHGKHGEPIYSVKKERWRSTAILDVPFQSYRHCLRPGSDHQERKPRN